MPVYPPSEYGDYQQSGNSQQHSLEEIRSAVYAILNNQREGQYISLKNALTGFFTGEGPGGAAGPRTPLSAHDANLYLEVFWGLFREGVISLGLNDSNPNFPFYHVTELGNRILTNQHTYFFTDVSDFERRVLIDIPSIDPVTMIYAKEAVQTFKIGAVLASSVMIGVASEHTFNLLVDTVEANPAWNPQFSRVFRENKILPRLNEFKRVLDANPTLLSREIKEDLDTRFTGIISLIRTFRNEAGHPTGKIIDREQAYVNIQLFIPYAKKLYQLMDFFK